MNNFDLIAIGDVVTDAFIKLKDAEVKCDEAGRECLLSFRFGDKIPYESVTVVAGVGNSPNAAVAAARLGLNSALITNIGADAGGQEILAGLEQKHVATQLVIKQADHKSNYHYVLWYGADRTILVKHEKYDYELPAFGAPRWLYLSSLGGNSLAYHQQIAAYLEENPSVKLAFQPGTFQIKLGSDQLAAIYRRTEAFFCNMAEAKKILQTNDSEPKNLLAGLNKLGPKIVAITDGPAGAYLLADDKYWQMPIYPDPKPPVERTGAGDAFAATFTAMLALNKTPLEALALAPINSMSVVQNIGAQAGLLPLSELERLLAQSPDNYRPKQI